MARERKGPCNAGALSFATPLLFTLHFISQTIHERDMALWDRVKTELDRAGRVAQEAFDEGRLRLEMLRARRLADAAAQRLGYAVYKGRREGRELTTDEYAGLARAIEAAEAEVDRYRRLLDETLARRKRGVTLQPPPATP